MLKWILIGFMMLGIMGVGFFLEKRYKDRAALLKEVTEFFLFAGREIGALKTDMVRVITRFAEDKNTPFAKLLLVVRRQLEGGEPLLLGKCVLNKKETGLVTRFFEDMATTSYQTHKGVLEKYTQEADALSKTAIKEKKEKGELAKKLCILLGIAVFIVLI